MPLIQVQQLFLCTTSRHSRHTAPPNCSCAQHQGTAVTQLHPIVPVHNIKAQQSHSSTQLFLCTTSRHSSHTAPPNLHLYIRCRCKCSFVPSHFILSTHQLQGSAGCTANMDILRRRKISCPWQQSHPRLVTHSLGYPNSCTSLPC